MGMCEYECQAVDVNGLEQGKLRGGEERGTGLVVWYSRLINTCPFYSKG